MQNTKVLNNKAEKKDEILFLSGECIRASGLLTLEGPQAVGPLPSQTYPVAAGMAVQRLPSRTWCPT